MFMSRHVMGYFAREMNADPVILSLLDSKQRICQSRAGLLLDDTALDNLYIHITRTTAYYGCVPLLLETKLTILIMFRVRGLRYY